MENQGHLPPVYYTLQIQYGSTIKHETFEQKDLEFIPGANVAEYQWRKELQESIYRRGFMMQTSPTTWELISPLRVHTAFLIRQDKKFGS